jgi:hypothetical protein
MEYLTPSFLSLLEHFQPCFRAEAFANFQSVIVAWLLTPGTRTLTEVWQLSPTLGRKHFDAIYHLFAHARWDWDELGAILCLLLLQRLLPSGYVWIVIDDTLCHKRGAKVAGGGFFLDPVQSSKKRKVFAFGVNYVVLGLVVQLPFRPNRYHCLPVLWRVYHKKGQKAHRKRTQLAAELAGLFCQVASSRALYLVADNAYINAAVLQNRPANLHVIGPLSHKAALYALPEPLEPGVKRRGRPPKKGGRLPVLPTYFDDVTLAPAATHEVTFAGETVRTLRLQGLSNVLWYTGCKTAPVQVVLVRDPSPTGGAWRDTALLCTDVNLSLVEVVQGYARRWSIEVMFHDSKQYLGLEDPEVRCERSVERTHPVAWFCYTLTLLWQAVAGASQPSPRRERPWYVQALPNAFAEILGRLRLVLWQDRLFGEAKETEMDTSFAEKMAYVLQTLATVR